MKKARLLTFVCICFLASFAIGQDAVRWADPQGFFERESIRRTQLAPGLVWITASGLRGGLVVETQILDVNLVADGLRLEAWVGEWMQTRAGSGQYVARFTPGQMLRESDALAALNASFFDIKATQTPFGLVMRDGWLLREPTPRDYPAVLSLADGRVLIGRPGWSGKIKVENREMPLAGVNRALLQEREVVLFCPPWKRTPDPAAPFLRARGAFEIVLRRISSAWPERSDEMRVTTKVVAIRNEPDRTPRELADNEMAMVAGPRAVEFFHDVKEGASLDIDWRLTDLPDGIHTRDVRHAVAGNVVLIEAGKLQNGGGAFWTTRHPRSAIGVDADGRRALLVLADGRSLLSAGMDLTGLRDYLAYLGAHDAINLDGGGSSAMAARVPEGAEGTEKAVRILNRPSDGRERLIPTALGVFRREGAVAPNQ